MAQKEEAKTPAKKGGLMKILLIVVGALVLVAGAVGATLFFTGALHQTADASSDHKPAAKTAKAAKAGGGHGGGEAPTGGNAAIYQPLDPPFIINFDDQGMMRYLQIGLSVMARDKVAIDAVNNNMPQIRNNLILLFGNQKVELLNSNEGKEKLRAQALEQVQTILNQEICEPGIEAIYYTAFVMQ